MKSKIRSMMSENAMNTHPNSPHHITDSPSGPGVLAVIPARYASTRFPGKPLVDIGGKPMIRHVWERVWQARGIADVVIATDDERIRQAALAFGAKVRMTSPAHPSGTDRVWEVAADLPQYTWILNVQGDEPRIDPAHLTALVETPPRFPDADIVTLVSPLDVQDGSDLATREAWRDPNVVKAVLSGGRALYFSRASIPWNREDPAQPKGAYRHIGLYLYRREALARLTSLPPSPLEEIEKLEQLRALEAGMSIYAVPVDRAPVGIDTPEDLRLLAHHPS